MKLHSSRVTLLFMLFEIVMIVSLVSCNPWPGGNNDKQTHPQVTEIPTSNAITLENALPGTSNWEIPDGKGASTQIQAYASATSVLPGQTLTFYASTQKEGTPYSIEIYRLGWYGGSGGRLMASIEKQVGFAQGYYDQHAHHLVRCSSCLVDTSTGLVEANWLPSTLFTVPSNWVTGVYLAKFIDAKGLQTYVPFDVRGNAHSLYIAVTSNTTYAAYNDWGGYSLYRSFGTGEEPGSIQIASLVLQW